jgi:hypothetical protein
MIETLFLFELIDYERVGSQLADRRNSHTGAPDWGFVNRTGQRQLTVWLIIAQSAQKTHKTRKPKDACTLTQKAHRQR